MGGLGSGRQPGGYVQRDRARGGTALPVLAEVQRVVRNDRDGRDTFKLADTWDGEQSLLGYNGPSLLSAASMNTRDNDDSLHFVDFARLDASQATGDDATTCAAVRKLAPTLTPDASN